MRELMELDKDADEVQEDLVNKLKASILVDVKGIREEIISSFNSAAYDILQDVLGEHLPKVLQDNGNLKSMILDLTKEVSTLKEQVMDLKHAISKFHNSLTSPGPDSSQSESFLSKPQPSTEYPLDQFRIHLKSPVFQPANEQRTIQEETQHQTPNLLNETFPNARSWTSPEEQPDYEAEPDHSSSFNLHFPPMPKNKQKMSAPCVNSTSTIKKGWAIAASSLPVSISNFSRQEPKQPQLSHLEISGELPDFQNASNGIQFLLPIFNSRLCPSLFCDVHRELLADDIRSLVDITPHRKVKTWLLQFADSQLTAFIFEHRRKLSTLPKSSEISSSPKLYVNPNLSPEDKAQQIKVLRAFNKLRFIGNESSFSVFPQGFSIKIVYEAKRFFYSFDSRKSPQEFLKSKNIKFKE